MLSSFQKESLYQKGKAEKKPVVASRLICILTAEQDKNIKIQLRSLTATMMGMISSKTSSSLKRRTKKLITDDVAKFTEKPKRQEGKTKNT